MPGPPRPKRWLTWLIGFLLAVVLIGSIAPGASAAGGHYFFEGGTSYERQQVLSALNVSSFNWNVVPWTVKITIHRGTVVIPTSVVTADSLVSGYSAPRHIVFDSSVLDQGEVSWGIVQHEYAHQVDESRFNNAIRKRLTYLLVAKNWWQTPGEPHGMAGAERFASTLAWTYWPSPHNIVGSWQANESHAMLPGPFKRLMRSLVGCC